MARPQSRTVSSTPEVDVADRSLKSAAEAVLSAQSGNSAAENQAWHGVWTGGQVEPNRSQLPI